MSIQPHFQRYQPVDAGFKLEKSSPPKLNAMNILLNVDGNDYRDAKQRIENSMRIAKEVFWKLW